jgi:small GTP-binding protein
MLSNCHLAVGMRGSDVVEEIDMKVVLLGDSGVGKTSLLVAFAGEEGLAERSTVCCSHTAFREVTSTGMHVNIHVWDIPGQQEMRNVASVTFREMDFGLLCRCSDSQEAVNSIKDWIKTIGDVTNGSAFLSVRTKCDLPDQVEEAYQDAEREIAAALNYTPRQFRTSAVTREGVSDLFQAIVEMTPAIYAARIRNREAPVAVNVGVRKKVEDWCKC